METTLQTININNHNLSLKEINNQRVVTFKDVDELHERSNGTAGRNFRENREHFIEGEDFFKICPDEIRRNKIMDISPKTHQDIVFLTEYGYLMLVKSLTDKLAWQVQRQLIKGYFRSKSTTIIPPQSTNPLLEQSIMSLQQSQQHIIDCTMEQGYQLADHEEQLETINESISSLDRCLQYDLLHVDKMDEIQNEFDRLYEVVDELKRIQNIPTDCVSLQPNLHGRPLLHSIIQPLAEKWNDGSMGYNATYRKVYIKMGVNWKYRMTRFVNQNEVMKKPNKIDLVATDNKLLELFKDTVTKLLQD